MVYEDSIGIETMSLWGRWTVPWPRKKGDGRFKNLVVHLYFSSRLGNTLHVALLHFTCADRQPMQASINGGNRAPFHALSLAS
jgi:hypothetical protein